MSRHGLWLTVLCSAIGGAQSAESYRRQVDVLEPARRRAHAVMKSREQTRQQKAAAVTIARGHLRIVADSSLVTYVLEAADSAAHAIDATFGRSARLLAERPVIVRERRLRENRDSVTRVVIEVGGQERVIAPGSAVHTRRQLIAALTSRPAASPLHFALDDSLRSWFQVPLPAAPETRTDRAMAYAEVVTTSTDLSRRCLAGDVGGCRALVGLSPIADPVVEGYTAAQRRALVAAKASELRRYRTAAAFDRCVGGSDDAACIERLRELPEETILRSVASVGLRHSFARAALRRGGVDAYGRLESSDSLPLDARFAVAARMAADSLVMAWRADILAARPAPASVTPSTALASIAWIAAFGALAMRSSRWR